MDENEITQRLRDAGDRPVPGEVRATHLSQMHAAVPAAEKPKRFGRLAVAAAAFVGFAVGSTGFAMAGALPAPAQEVAHDVLAVVQVNVPDGEYKNRGECVSAAAKANPTDEAAKQLAKEGCPKGKPAHAGQGKGKGRPDGAGPPGGHPNDVTDDCKGRPPWAGKAGKDLTPDQKQAMRDQHAAKCGRGLDDDPAEAEAEKREEQQERDAEALEEQREAEAEPQAPAEQAPADPGAQGQSDSAPELPGPLAPDAGADAEAQDTDPAGG